MATTKVTSNLLAPSAAQTNINSGASLTLSVPTQVNNTLTTNNKVVIDSANAIANPKMLIMATTASGAADNAPLVIKGSGVNMLASVNLRTTGGSGESYDAWVTGKVGGGIQVNNSFTVSSGNSGPVTGSTLFIVQSTGNVGVGTLTPTSSFSRTIQVTGDGSSAITLSNVTATKKYSFGLTSTNSLGFYDETASTYRMSILTTGEIGIGTTSPNTKAALDITSTTKGFLPPRMTTTQRNLIASPPAGLVIYNTTTNNLNSYSGSAWVELVDSADLGTNVANFLESPTSDNLASALTDENGTGGGFVRAEGATLTTPTFTGSAARANGQNAVPATSDEVMTRAQCDSRIGKVAVMSADVTVVSSTTPVPLTASSSNHPDGLSELGFTLAANKTYAFEFIGEFYEATSPKNQLFTLAGPSGSSFSSRIIAGSRGSTAVYQIGGESTVANLISTGSTNGVIKIYGLIKMGETSGNVTLRFSQNSSTANPTTILKGSTIILFGGA